MKIDESICNELIKTVKRRENALVVIPPLVNVDVDECFKSRGIEAISPGNFKGWRFLENLFGIRRVVLIKDLRDDFVNWVLHYRRKKIPIVCVLRMGNQMKTMATILGKYNLSKWDIFDRILELKLGDNTIVSQDIQEKYSYLSVDQKLMLKNIYFLNVLGITPDVETLLRITNIDRKVVEETISLFEFFEFVKLEGKKILGNMEVLEYLFGAESLREDYIKRIYDYIEVEDLVKLVDYIYDYGLDVSLGLEILKSALMKINVINNPKLYANIKYYQAKLHIKLLSLTGGNPEKIITYAKESAEIRKRLGDEIGYIDALNLIGIGYLTASQSENSLNNLINAEKTFIFILDFTKDKYPLEMAIASVNLGITYLRFAEIIGDITYALKGEYHLKDAIKVFRSLNLKDRLLNALINLGVIYDVLGRLLGSDKYYAEAISAYRMAKDLAKNRERSIISLIDNNLALALMGLAKVKKDIKYLHEAENILVNLPIPENAPLMHLRKYKNLASVYYAMFEISRDRNYLYKSAEYLEKILEKHETLTRPPYFCSVALELSEVYGRLGMFDRIKSLMKRVINVAGKNNLEHYKKQAEEILEKFKGF
ncbi:MAG: hypothetical protein ABIL50_01955 [candidate division WOR-3 bacterium]